MTHLLVLRQLSGDILASLFSQKVKNIMKVKYLSM